MKTAINLLLVLILIVQSFAPKAQTKTRIKLSKHFRTIDGRKYYFKQGEYLCSVKTDDYHIYLHKSDPLKPGIVKISRNSIPDRSRLETVILFHDKVYVLFSKFERANKKLGKTAAHHLHYSVVDFNKMVLSEPQSLVSTTKKISKRISIQLSKDQTKLLAHYTLRKKAKEGDLQFMKLGFHVFGDNLKLVHEGLVQLPYDHLSINLGDFLVSNEGKPGLWVSKIRKKEKELLLFDLAQAPQTEHLTLKTNHKEGINYFTFQDKDLNWNLLTTNKQNNTLVLRKIDSDSILKSNSIPIYLLKKYENKEKFSGFYIQDVVACPDGYLIYFQEYYYKRTDEYGYSKEGSYGIESTYEKTLKDKFFMKVDENFEKQWVQRIEQREHNNQAKFYIDESSITFLEIKKAPKEDVQLTSNMTLEERQRVIKLLKDQVNTVIVHLFDIKTGASEKVNLLPLSRIDENHDVTQVHLFRVHQWLKNMYLIECYSRDELDYWIRVDF